MATLPSLPALPTLSFLPLLLCAILLALWCVGPTRSAPDFMTEPLDVPRDMSFAGHMVHHSIQALIAASAPDDVLAAERDTASLYWHGPEQAYRGSNAQPAASHRAAAQHHLGR